MPRAFLIKNKVRCAAPLSTQPGVCVQDDGHHRGAQGESQEMADHVHTTALTERPLKPLHLLRAPDLPVPEGDRRANSPPPGGAGGSARLHEDPDPGDQPPRTSAVHSNPGGPQSPSDTYQSPPQGNGDAPNAYNNGGSMIEIKSQVEVHVLEKLEKVLPKDADKGTGEQGNIAKPNIANGDTEVRNGERTTAGNSDNLALEKMPPFRSPGGGDEGGVIPIHPSSWVWWERAWSDLHGVRRQFLQGGQPLTPPGAALHPTPPVPAAASSTPSSWMALPEAVRTRPDVIRREEGGGERAAKAKTTGVVTEGCSISSLPCRPQVFRPSPGRLAPPHGPPQVWGSMSSMVGGLPPPHHLLSLPPPHLAALQAYHPALRPPLGPPYAGPLDPSTFHSELSRAQELKLSRDPGGFSMSGLERITSSLFSFNDRESKINSNLKQDSLRTHVPNEGDRNSSANKTEPQPKHPQPRQNQSWRSVTTEKVVAAGERRSTSEGQGRDLSQRGQGHDPLSRLKLEYGSRGEQEAPRRTMNPPRYQCEACNKSYATFSGLSKHKQFHCVSQVRKQFSCKFCDKMYVSLGALKMHIRTHTLPCKCQLCGKAFSRPWLLQGHVRTHTGEKPFQCAHCGRSFADRSNLRAHLQTHTDIKKYNCHVCSKTFSRMSLLLKHQDGGCPGSL